MNKKLQAAIVGLSATVSAFSGSAQAATFGSSTFNADFNGSFTPAAGTTTNAVQLANNPTIGYLPQWNTGPGHDLNFLVPFATAPGSSIAQGYTNLSTIVSNNGQIRGNKLVSNGTNNLLTAPDGLSQWYIVADSNNGANGAPNYSRPISQTISGLTVGSQYEVSFWQTGGEWAGITGGYNNGWQVSFGSDTRIAGAANGSALMNVAASRPSTTATVDPWTKQTLTFTANNTSQLLSFLATSPSGDVPPMALLTGVTFQAASTSTSVPEPLEYVGTIVGLGVCLVLRSKLTKAKSEDDN
jgi:hypothetical protein